MAKRNCSNSRSKMAPFAFFKSILCKPKCSINRPLARCGLEGGRDGRGCVLQYQDDSGLARDTSMPWKCVDDTLQ